MKTPLSKYIIPFSLSALFFSLPSGIYAEVPQASDIKVLINAAKGTSEQNLYAGREAFINYDFPKAGELYGKYRVAKKKSAEGLALEPVFNDQLEIAEESLNNVQRLKIIERKSVADSDFISSLRLPASAGRVVPADSIPFQQGRDEATVAFANENGDYMIWSQSAPEDAEDMEGAEPDTYILVESERLTDGSWSTPAPLRGLGQMGWNADYPFLRADGTTLYFSAPSEGSMGGYDLFVASRDPQTGEFLTPRNLGMPFNSPLDDLMVAIDEEHNLGWLVTERNADPGFVSVYLYIFEEQRSNHDPEEEAIIDHARLTDKSDFLAEDDLVRAEKLRDLEMINRPRTSRKGDFLISIPGGKVYDRVENFSSPKARIAAAKYLETLQALEEEKDELKKLRSDYGKAKHEGKKSVMQFLSTRILLLEKKVAQHSQELKTYRNQAIEAESSR